MRAPLIIRLIVQQVQRGAGGEARGDDGGEAGGEAGDEAGGAASNGQDHAAVNSPPLAV